MVDGPHQVLGIASITRVHRACKSFISKWKYNKKSFSKDGQAQVGANRERYKSKTKIIEVIKYNSIKIGLAIQ